MPAATDLPWQELDASLRTFIGRRIRNQADVDDLVQRVLLQIVKGVASLRDTDRLYAWVYRTARNVIIDHYRSAGVRREVRVETDGEPPVEASATQLASDDDGAALEELATCLAPMLNQLPPAYHEALRLAELEGLTQAEAAARAGVSVSGMKSRVQRGRRQLRAVLEACCRIDLDRRGAVVGFDRREADSCGGCGGSCD